MQKKNENKNEENLNKVSSKKSIFSCKLKRFDSFLTS